jgi:hypothetical protein
MSKLTNVYVRRYVGGKYVYIDSFSTELEAVETVKLLKRAIKQKELELLEGAD